MSKKDEDEPATKKPGKQSWWKKNYGDLLVGLFWLLIIGLLFLSSMLLSA